MGVNRYCCVEISGRLSGKRAKQGARAGRVGLEVMALTAVLLLITVGEVPVQQYSQQQT